MPAHDRPLDPAQRLRIGIVGAGPGGLGAAIFLSRLENVEVKVFEQAKELREIGAGIHLQRSLFSVRFFLVAVGLAGLDLVPNC